MVNRPEPKNSKNRSPRNALSTMEVTFKDPLKDVHTANLLISGCGWVDTDAGVVLIDTWTYGSCGWS